MEDLKGLSQEELEVKIAAANESYKNLESNADRGAQKVLDDKKLAERALTAIAEIDGDNEKFVELYNNDPKLGDYLLKTVFKGASIDDFKKGGTKSPKPEWEDFDAKRLKKTIEEKVESVSSKLPKEIKEKFDAEYKELTDWKKLTKDNVEKYIKMALREVQPDFSQEELDARVLSQGGGGIKPKADKSFKWDKSTSEFLKKMGIITPSKKD